MQTGDIEGAAKLYEQNGQVEKSSRLYADFYEKNAMNDKAAEMYQKLKEFEKAAGLYEKGGEIEKATQMYGLHHYSVGNYEKALECLKDSGNHKILSVIYEKLGKKGAQHENLGMQYMKDGPEA